MSSYCLVSTLFTPRVRVLRKGRQYVFGRDQACEFVLPSETVSRRHAEIAWGDKTGFLIRDLGSKNGTRVNDQRVDWRPLKDGDRIWIGPFSVLYREYGGNLDDILKESETGDAEKTVAIPKTGFLKGMGTGFAGKFAGTELIEICQLVAINEKDGVLTIHGPTALAGRIAFVRGSIVDADCGEVRGADAALKLLLTPSGTFDFSTTRPDVPKPQPLPTQHILMEAARLRDESAQALPPTPPSTGADGTAATQGDDWGDEWEVVPPDQTPPTPRGPGGGRRK